MARDQYGLDINRGPFGISSRLALIGAKIAESAGKGKPYHERVMRAYWQEAQDISDRSTLVRLAQDAGLDAPAFESALDEPEYDDLVRADIEQAYAFGLQGVPALVLDDRYLLSGAQPLSVLQRAVLRVQAELE